MRVWIGRTILVIAAIHTAFGIIVLSNDFAPAVRAGLFNTVTLTVPSAAETAFWFFVSGSLAFMLGGLVHHLERLDMALPRFLPWSLLALTIAGCAIMPVSAWWLLFLPVAGMFARRTSAGSRASAAHPTQR